MSQADETDQLLERWRAGDARAVQDLLVLFYSSLRKTASRELDRAPHLRRDFESLDIVQTIALNALERTPRGAPRNVDELRALLHVIVQNEIRQAIRDRELERRIPGADRVSDLRSPSSSASPERAAVKSEDRQWVLLALHLLSEEERELVRLVVDGVKWTDIGARLGVREDAARMRFARLQPKLANLIRRLQDRGLGSLLPPTLD